MMEFYKRKDVKSARLPHDCHLCGCMIMLHEPYIRESGKWRGEFFDRCSHRHCFNILSRCMTEYELDEYDDDTAEEFARETFCSECDQLETCRIRALQCGRIKRLIELEGRSDNS